MSELKPQLLLSLRNYSKEAFVKDLISGIIVAIIALPLSIALALASGVSPEQGLYTAIVAGFLISALGGSKVQIAGPTAAFATIVAGIVARNGMDGLAVATILAGILLIIMGLLRMGSMIKYIPYTITTGFTAGIAVTILIGQIKDFMGLTFQTAPVETMEKLEQVVLCIGTMNATALGVGCLALAIRAAKEGGTAPAILNGANEVAVARFLAGEIGFLDIARVVEHALDTVPRAPLTLEAVYAADRAARAAAEEACR